MAFAYYSIFIVLPLAIAIVFTIRSKKRWLMATWFAASYAWAFYSFFARAAYVEEAFIETTVWITATYPMYLSQNWGMGLPYFFFSQNTAHFVSELIAFPVAFAVSLFSLWLSYWIGKTAISVGKRLAAG